ncbi:hypothetical protein ACFHW2_19635 [Actinomadura sp. LOL_016]|uniref:hypothetical protein n=1 Tax=Actinomadura sp. LOL_016 TaxID=3345411 RepID=UPI003A8B7C10
MQQGGQQRRAEREHEGRRGDAGREHRDAEREAPSVPARHPRYPDEPASVRRGASRRHPHHHGDRGREQDGLDGEHGPRGCGQRLGEHPGQQRAEPGAEHHRRGREQRRQPRPVRARDASRASCNS